MFTILLTGCDSANIKRQLQENHDKLNPNGDRGICLYLGDLKNYPYTTKYMEKNEYNERMFYGNDRFKKRLAGFSEIGMFTREKVAEEYGEDIYRYDLTDLGTKYLKSNNFCFGRVTVTGVNKLDVVTDSIGRTTKMVRFQFEIENVPVWVTTNLPIIAQLYGEGVQRILTKNEGSSLMRFIKVESGWSMQEGVIIQYGYY
ncbi:hypothetical protein [Orbus mooreae]|uniref:hypothetical protein n=1 Tax=Orbus mooreae TaxID=3074107 RepID=UPI00370D25CE